jgi:hypothetical protein
MPTGVVVVRTVTPEAVARWVPNRFFPSIARAQAARMPSIGQLRELLRRRDFADRYPFLSQDELDLGLTTMREHWATHQGECVDDRESTFVIAGKAQVLVGPAVTRIR